MSAGPARIGTLTIANNETESTPLSSILSAGQRKTLLASLVDLLIYGPEALTSVVTVEVKALEAGTDWKELEINGVDVTINAGRAVPIPVASFSDLRLVAASAEGAERLFVLRGQVSLA